MQSLLDIFEEFGPQVELLKLHLENYPFLEAKARILAEAAAEIVNKPRSVKEFLPNTIANLRAVEPLSKNVVAAVKLVVKEIERWTFDATGRIDSPPALSAAVRDLELTHEELNVVHTLAYIHYPPKLLNYATFSGITDSLTRDLSKSQRPVAIITVGPPGSGKSFMLSHEFGCVSHLRENFGGPSADCFEEIDPDYWISSLCNNDNSYRSLCNMLNLESFFLAVNQRYNIIFGGSGKDVKNTCGRITARLKQANYRIFYVLVLSTYDSCMKRIRNRSETTGCDTSEAEVQGLFKGLQEAVPVYVKNQALLCDALLLYENSTSGQTPNPIVVSGGINAARALELASKCLALPTDAAVK